MIPAQPKPFIIFFQIFVPADLLLFTPTPSWIFVQNGSVITKQVSGNEHGIHRERTELEENG